MAQLLMQDFVIPTAPETDFLPLRAKRYRPSHPIPTGKKKVALVFTSSTGGAPREAWQTSIERLFEIQHICKRRTKTLVSEAWALELPNHESAAIIGDGPVAFDATPDASSWLARALRRFVCSNITSVDIIIPVGYADSCPALVLATVGMDLHRHPMIILVEPLMTTHQVVTAPVKTRWFHSRPREASSYASSQYDTPSILSDLCRTHPVHGIFGGKSPFVAAAVVSLKYGRLTSITGIPGAGHQVVEEQPFKLAERIFSILNPDDYSVYKL
ncbi:hypothetical protein R3P38DRAFT_3176899 [Favolaschia claudopus]|uniref:Uncharacterized protein n=1 Tax=Favolaschia claudopus TaxID=2862362 RepID=A0AAW0CZK7_9AGAR